MHQDHGASPAVCQASIRSGFSSAPSSYEYKVAVTREVATFAHHVGVSVEGELGTGSNGRSIPQLNRAPDRTTVPPEALQSAKVITSRSVEEGIQ
jgi:fructose/tagatose bisphosphate aldolase